ncbi:MAG TPA: prepilin-type N-terminal cleavage/methylation domain-containing protein [Myxococcales bacterium LLY-WYZ-16_1]|nr:prepilin-type N-terminal cleavage/methylation domain-containing protein [Myxococcales bacterium LLY-WYZ-16_1]
MASQRGFTLMEAVVAVGVFAVAVTAVSYLTRVSTRTASTSNAMTQAAYLLEHRVDELSLLGADFLRSSGCMGAPTSCAAGPNALAADGPCTQYTEVPLDLTTAAPQGPDWTFRVDTTLSNHGSAHNPNAVIADVQVCWREVGTIRQIGTQLVVRER